MTKVTYFEDYYCFEYHSRHGAPQRFRYYLIAPVYIAIPVLSISSTHWPLSWEEPVFSSDFFPSRLVRQFED